MGLPQIIIQFKTLAETLVSRSERGIVAVILKDNTSTFDTKTYTKESEITKSHYTATNLAYLSQVFLGNPSAVIVERISTDGSIDTALNRLKNKKWNWLTVPSVQSGETGDIADWVKEQRSTYHKTFKAVLPSTAADSEGVVNFATEGIKVGTKTYAAAEYCPRIAGILAGLSLNRSATYYALSEVESITESEDPNTDIDSGKMILINDGTKIKIARAVNSLATLTDTSGEDFKKIKIVEAADMIRDDIRTTFEDEFIGKVENSYDNKIIFLAAVNKYLKDLAASGVLYDKFDNKAEIDINSTTEWLKLTRDISSWDEEKIKTANTGTNVFVKANIQIQDAMEDLKFTIYMD
ncbi:MAG: phage tail sheath C-terminal domain-containing protein [Bacillota bacterium]|nr:phage tail sheath C-terminal domain-containing protein [Bacillota bacterium]